MTCDKCSGVDPVTQTYVMVTFERRPFSFPGLSLKFFPNGNDSDPVPRFETLNPSTVGKTLFDTKSGPLRNGTSALPLGPGLDIPAKLIHSPAYTGEPKTCFK